jgi:transcriptional regulator with XRE-family HTH domain
MIRELCEKKNISLAELARRIGQSPQNFNKKLKRGTVSFEEMMEIAKALNVKFEQAFVLLDGEKIKFEG